MTSSSSADRLGVRRSFSGAMPGGSTQSPQAHQQGNAQKGSVSACNRHQMDSGPAQAQQPAPTPDQQAGGLCTSTPPARAITHQQHYCYHVVITKPQLEVNPARPQHCRFFNCPTPAKPQTLIQGSDPWKEEEDCATYLRGSRMPPLHRH
jgi:hypothetical protein